MPGKQLHRKNQRRWSPSALWESLESRQLLSASANPIAEPLGTAVPLIGSIPAGSASPPGYSPTQIRQAYGINNISFNGVTGNGAGQTIAIITAYDNPEFVNSSSSGFDSSDLHKFDVAMGLPDPPSFKKVDENGNSSYPSADPGWANEAALDVEWSHAIAPQANIILVEAYSAGLSDLINTAVQYARQQPGVSVINMSFATSETSFESNYDSYFETPSGHAGVTFVAASGDNGSQGGYPAYSPNVLAVGATTLSLNGSNNISSETGHSTSGGGVSSFESKPSYQFGVTQSTTHRTTPDVSIDGDPNTGVSVYDSYNGGAASPWYKVGGTSLSSPMWSALIAIADQGRASAGLGSMDGVSQTLPRLYSLNSSDFNDIVSGNNGYAAGTGYDLVTGRGSPIANKLIPDLAGANSVNGTVFNDTNGNGKLDSGETGISGVGVFVDLYGTGAYKGLDTRVVSSSNGTFTFSDLPGGTYKLTETTPTGDKQTTSEYTITIGYRSKLTGYNFGNQSSTQTSKGSIAGYVFGDANDNAKWDSTETGVAGVSVYIDTNNNGKEDAGDVILTTSSTGYFDFTGLANATYIIREVLPSGKKLTTPTSGFYSVSISNGYNATGKNFGITGGSTSPITGSIAGYTFADTNDNGKWDSTEKAIAGVTVYIDKNNDGKEDSGDVVLVTNSAGYFDFTGLVNGTYVVREIVPSGKKLSTPTGGSYTVTISNAYNATGKNFGNA